MVTLAGVARARYFEAVSSPLPMDPLDLAASLTALAHGLSLQRPQKESGAANPAGIIIDGLLNCLVRHDGHLPPSVRQEML